MLWLTCLPFVIWQELGWFSVPISMIVSFLLFGIEEIGVQIEVGTTEARLAVAVADAVAVAVAGVECFAPAWAT